MGDEPLVAHSLTEAHLCFLATACRSCAGGPLEVVKIDDDRGEEDPAIVVIYATCGSCNEIERRTFSIPRLLSRSAKPGVDRINPSETPSSIIDVGQWLSIYRVLMEAARDKADAGKARFVKLQAAECLDEALKFYGNDSMPSPAAFSCAESKRRLEENPNQFDKARLLDLRSRLPKPSASQQTAEDKKGGRRKWWQR